VKQAKSLISQLTEAEFVESKIPDIDGRNNIATTRESRKEG